MLRCVGCVCYTRVGPVPNHQSIGGALPSTIPVTHDQLVELAKLGCDVVLNELPTTPTAGDLNVWTSLAEDSQYHRDIVYDHKGNILADAVLEG